MNDAAEEIISKDNNYSAMTNAICDVVKGIQMNLNFKVAKLLFRHI